MIDSPVLWTGSVSVAHWGLVPCSFAVYFRHNDAIAHEGFIFYILELYSAMRKTGKTSIIDAPFLQLMTEPPYGYLVEKICNFIYLYSDIYTVYTV